MPDWPQGHHAPGPRRLRPGSPPRVGFPQHSFSPAFAQMAQKRCQSPAWPAGGEPRANPIVQAGFSLAALSTPPFAYPNSEPAGPCPHQVPTAWKCSVYREVYFLAH